MILEQPTTSETSSQKGVVKRKRGRKPSFKLSRFDKDVARLIQSGVVTLDAICLKLGVDQQAAKARLGVLVEKGLLVVSDGLYRLGVEGYNEFAPKLKMPEQKEPLDLIEVFSTTAKAHQPQTNAPIPLKQQSSVDLGEMLRKGAATPEPKLKEACELCRAEFKVSVKNPSAAKFAHCVCGAAYHKDCYHALLEGGKCARCERKLSLILDKSSEEAIKGIKNVFE